jgi:hypothetical protein
VTYNGELTDESREGNRLVSLPLLVLIVSVVLAIQESERMDEMRREDGQRIEGGTHLGNVINGDNVLVGMLIRLVDDGLDRSGIVLAWHCCCCCWYGYSSDRCN